MTPLDDDSGTESVVTELLERIKSASILAKAMLIQTSMWILGSILVFTTPEFHGTWTTCGSHTTLYGIGSVMLNISAFVGCAVVVMSVGALIKSSTTHVSFKKGVPALIAMMMAIAAWGLVIVSGACPALPNG